MNLGNPIQKIDFSGEITALVVNTSDPKGLGRIAVQIPKLMPGIVPSSNNINSVPIVLDKTCIIGESEYKSSLSNRMTSDNFFWIKSFKTKSIVCNCEHACTFEYPPKPDAGEYILIKFLDRDPQKGYALPVIL